MERDHPSVPCAVAWSITDFGRTRWRRTMKTAFAMAVAALLPVLASGQDSTVTVRVTNSLDAARPGETVELTAAALSGRVAAGDLARLAVVDRRTGHEVLAQAVDQDGDGAADRVVFQADLAPRETREFVVSVA